MTLYLQQLKLLGKRLLLLLILFSACRLYYYFLNFNYFSSLTFLEVIKIHTIGIQFDISAIVTINFIFILLHIIPVINKQNKIYQTILKYLFFVVNICLILFNIIDTEYFKFTNKRTTADFIQYVFLNEEDLMTLIPQYLADFWYHFICLFTLIGLLIYFYPKDNAKYKKDKLVLKKLSYQTLLFLGIIGFLILCSRGVYFKPLRIIDAVKYTEAKNMSLVLNTPFTLMKSIKNKELDSEIDFDSEKYDPIYNPIHKYNTNESFKNLNIVIFILESFSKEYIGSLNNNEGYTPFLDSLISKSLVFPNAFANGKRSIEAMPSIIASIPTLMNNSYVSSSFSSNEIYSLPIILKTKGYSSSFFHGGKNGTMGFDNFAKASGFDSYYGKNEYNNDADFDGNWGIFDEEFLQFMAQKMNSFKQPFFSCVFTLSSHHPYTIPEKYKGKFKEGPLPILKSVSYTDYALKKFFDAAKKMNWYKNTLFIFTADHTAPGIEESYNNKIGVYSIPMVYFSPSDPLFAGINPTITQHIDIMPSVLDYLNYENEFIAFGYSVFDTTKTHFAINYSNNFYQLIQNNYSLLSDGENNIEAYNIISDRLLKNNLIHSNIDEIVVLQNKLEAIIQSYNYRMLNNQMIIK